MNLFKSTGFKRCICHLQMHGIHACQKIMAKIEHTPGESLKYCWAERFGVMRVLGVVVGTHEHMGGQRMHTEMWSIVHDIHRTSHRQEPRDRS